MSREPETNVVEMPTDPSIVRRDRLLGALFDADPELCLLHHGPGFSHAVTTSAPPQIFLLPTRDRDAAERLPHRIEQIVAAFGGGPIPTHFVAVGGGPDVVAALRRAAPGLQRGTLGFHHVDDASTYAHVKGQKLQVIEKAASIMRATEPPSAERIVLALEKGRALMVRDQRAVARFRGNKTPITTAIIVVCSLIFALAWLWGRRAGGIEAIILAGATNGPLVREGQLYRLFSSMFLHWSLPHVVMNMLALSSLGFMLEPVLGPRRFVALYGLSGLAGALATNFGGAERFSAGASGAIWGCMTALVGIVLFPRGVLPPLMIARMKTDAWRPVLLNVGLSFLPGIDWRAHFGGGALGFVLGVTVLGRGLVPMEERVEGQNAERGKSPVSTAAALFLLAAAIGSLAWFVAVTKPWTMGEPPKMTRAPLGHTGLSLEVPTELAKEVREEALEDAPIPATKFVLGQRERSPVTFDVFVERLSEELTADELDAFFDGQRAQADENAPYSNAERVDKARIVKVGGSKAVVVDHVAGDTRMRTYLVVVDGRVVTVRSYARKERPEGWKGLEEKVAASIASQLP